MPWQCQGLILHQLNLCFEYTLFIGGGLIQRVLTVLQLRSGMSIIPFLAFLPPLNEWVDYLYWLELLIPVHMQR